MILFIILILFIIVSSIFLCLSLAEICGSCVALSNFIHLIHWIKANLDYVTLGRGVCRLPAWTQHVAPELTFIFGGPVMLPPLEGPLRPHALTIKGKCISSRWGGGVAAGALYGSDCDVTV